MGRLRDFTISPINRVQHYILHCAARRQRRRMMSLDSGMLVVVTIVAMYMTLVFILLFYVKNEWCDILHYNLTVSTQPLQTLDVTYLY